MTNEKPFFTDYQTLNLWERELTPILSSAKKAFATYKQISGYSIPDYTGFKQLIENPEGFYRGQYFEANKKDFALFQKLNLDFSDRIQLPENFAEVVSAVERFKRELGPRDIDYFDLVKGEICVSQKAIERRNAKAYYFAESAEEKRRLKICEAMIQAFAEVEHELQSQLKPVQFEQIAESKPHFKPLPYQLRLAPDQRGGWELKPNPAYVLNSYRGTSHLGFHWHTPKEVERLKKDAEAFEARRAQPAEVTRWAVYNEFTPN
jgi:hypothetical protein